MNMERKNEQKLKPPKEWFKQTDYDLDTAEEMFKTKRYIYTVFMCHLSIEKALKGLYRQNLYDIPPKVHNLIYLIKKIDLPVPDNLKEYSKQRVTDILEKSKEALKWLKERLKK